MKLRVLCTLSMAAASCSRDLQYKGIRAEANCLPLPAVRKRSSAIDSPSIKPACYGTLLVAGQKAQYLCLLTLSYTAALCQADNVDSKAN